MTDEQIEKVAREIITIGVEACGVPRDFDPSQLENGIDALLGADDAESWRGIARWHIQQVEAEVRKFDRLLDAAARVDAANAKRASAQVQDFCQRLDYEQTMGAALDQLRLCLDDIRQRGGEATGSR